MSGICGLFDLDGAPVADEQLRMMAAMLERRGPERTGMFRDGSVGLAHTLLATTPELLFERQPFRHTETGCVITADVRLDNREELIGKLGILRKPESVGDSELILAAYIDCGDDCPTRLLGDFAFAIWDPRHQRLFAARDHFGLRPFYFNQAAGKRFVFGSDPRPILVLPQVPYSINEGRIADFLVPELEWIDYTSSFFEGVYRLPPGHSLSVTRDRFIIEEYWRPEPGPNPGPMSDKDYRDGFVDVLTAAIESRLRAPPGAVGSMLSGGMDSGSVVAIASEILAGRGEGPLPTYSSAMPDTTDCAESRAIRAAMGLPSLSPTIVYPSDLDTMFDSPVGGNEEPFDGENMLLRAIYTAAHNQGRTVILDGAAGDVLLAEGSYIVRLIRHGKLLRAFREITGEQAFYGTRTLPSRLLGYTASALLPGPAKSLLRSLMGGDSLKGIAGHCLISRDFAERVDLKARHERYLEIFPRDWIVDYVTERCSAIRPNLTAGRERYARLAVGAGVEARDPFLDKRVVDYCAHLPGRMRLGNGWPKIILREVMEGRLPDEVRWSHGKPHLGWEFNAAMARIKRRRGELDIDWLRESLAPYVDPAALTAAWQAFDEGGNAESIHSATVLAVWLRENEGRPRIPDDM